MLKKIAIGGAVAGLLVAGAVSANQLGGITEATSASNEITVSGAVLEDLDIGTFEKGQDKIQYVNRITLDTDAPNAYVEIGLFGAPKANGDLNKLAGYIGPDGKSPADAEAYKTDANGVITFNVDVPAADLERINVNVSSSYTKA